MYQLLSSESKGRYMLVLDNQRSVIFNVGIRESAINNWSKGTVHLRAIAPRPSYALC